jgi:hypothetical protein
LRKNARCTGRHREGARYVDTMASRCARSLSRPSRSVTQGSTADPKEGAPHQHHTALQGAHGGAHVRRHDTIAHAVRVMRSPHGGPLFASLVWPYQAGYSSEAIDIPYVVSPKKGAYSRYSAGACAACVLLDLFSIEPSPLHVKCNMESPPTTCLRPAAGSPHGEVGRRPAPAPREQTREAPRARAECHQRWPRQWATTHNRLGERGGVEYTP